MAFLGGGVLFCWMNVEAMGVGGGDPESIMSPGNVIS